MRALSYAARTTTPDGTDIDRIVKQVIDTALFVQSKCHPGKPLSKVTAQNIAWEIKRLICERISVEVDLVINASTDEDDTPASGSIIVPALDMIAAQAVVPQFTPRNGRVMPLLYPSVNGIELNAPRIEFRGSLPGPI